MNPIDSALADLARLRAKRGWSQRNVGDKLGVCHATVSLWESGRRMPGIDRVREYAALFGFDLYLAPIGEDIEPDAELVALAALTPDDPALPATPGGQ